MFCPKKVNNSDKLFYVILAAVMLLGIAVGFALSRNEAYSEAVNEIVETFGKERIETYIISVAEEVLGEEEVTVETIKSAIEKNPNMGPRYKELADKLLDNIVREEPGFNLRLFYENIKSLTIKVFDEEEEKQNHYHTHYDVKKNIIYMKKGSDDPTVCHVLMYTARNLYRITDDTVLIVREKKGKWINEAVIDSMVATIYSGYDGSYYERKVLEYLLGVEGIDYEQYSRYGASYLIDDFKIKYKDMNADVDYIVHYFDTKKVSNSRINDTIRLEDNKLICNELFLVCLHNINPYDEYSSFKSFLDLLGYYNLPTFTNYQTKYNQHLIKMGMNSSYSEAAMYI